MVKRFIKKQINKTGFDLVKVNKAKTWPTDFEDFHKSVISKVEPYTMTSHERIFGLVEAVRYIINNKIDGDFVECGVWKGGSMLAMAETLVSLNVKNRELYLYDTYEGMPPPSAEDVSFDNRQAEKLLISDTDKERNPVWAYSTLESVKDTLSLSDYPNSRINYIKGKVEDTIPRDIPEHIALLRLDTDWYESTKHELEYLFPRLVKGGVLILDDYGFWKGARKAVDEYMKNNRICMLLNRLDDTGRIGIKL